MAPQDTINYHEGPRVVEHFFETVRGDARPTKTLRDNKDGLHVALSARRSHRKSRAGCLHCKKRRIKCDEQKPACANCSRKGHQCSYDDVSPSLQPGDPFKALKDGLSRHQNTPLAFPSMTTDTFTVQDMRFFHHFLIKAKPHMPVGNHAVWAREIPQFALHNSFLMDAMLALGSTHLGRLVDSDCYKIQSLTYRVRGLDGLRIAVAKPEWHQGDADSLIAAGYALIQQSAHLEDAMFEWLSLLRLIYSISKDITQSKLVATEFDIRPEKHMEHVIPYLHLLPAIDATLLHRGTEELYNLRPELMNEIAIDFHYSLIHCLKEHRQSPVAWIFCIWRDIQVLVRPFRRSICQLRQPSARRIPAPHVPLHRNILDDGATRRD